MTDSDTDKNPSDSWLDEITWNKDGLVPVVTQDAATGRLLTHAWVNREALQAAVAEQRAVYWSRSRSKIWRKGEESGFIQKLKGLYLDCDGDTISYQVEQVGGIACHTGRESCFYRKFSNNQWNIVDPVLRDPKTIYKQ